MSRTVLTPWNRPALLAFATLFALVTVTGEAWATCFTTGSRSPLPDAKTQFAAAAAAAALSADDRDDGPAVSPVGLWQAVFLIGSGPDAYDTGYQQFHSDGNENMLSRGVPPLLGNVCVGIWKRVGPRTFKLHHVAWNWKPDGTWDGTFQLDVTFRLDRRGQFYTGTWVADSFNTDGTVIPELHFEGIARATRIGFD